MGFADWCAARTIAHVPAEPHAELLRSHVRFKLRLRTLPAAERRSAATEALARLAALGDTALPAAPRAMVEICTCLGLHADARRLREEHGLPDADEQHGCSAAVEVCFATGGVVTGPIVPCRQHVHPVALARGSRTVEAASVPCDATLVFTHATTVGRVFLLVFPAPRELLVARSAFDVVGVGESSCMLYAANVGALEALRAAADDATVGRGARWVWVYAAADRERAAPSTLRQNGEAPWEVPTQGGTLCVQRQGLRWCMGYA